MIKPILFTALLLAGQSAFALDLVTQNSSVNKIVVYSDGAGGDLLVYLNAPTTGCEAGFWLAKTDSRNSTIVAFLLAAKAIGTNVGITGDKDQRWWGSSGNFCHIYNVSYE